MVTVHADIAALRDALTSDVVTRAYVDGGRTVQAFLAAGLLSDLIITRLPILLGDGIPLFGSLPSGRFSTNPAAMPDLHLCVTAMPPIFLRRRSPKRMQARELPDR